MKHYLSQENIYYFIFIRCEDLAEIIWLNRQQIRQLEMIHEGLNIPSQETSMNILPELADGLNVLLDSLVKSSFVIEKQPPQVLKTNTRFSATIRLLVGTKLNVHMSPPVIVTSPPEFLKVKSSFEWRIFR